MPQTLTSEVATPGTPGADGAPGMFGGGVSIEYTFSTTTTDSDPGSGNLRLDNATQNAATVIRADELDVNAVSWATVLDAMTILAGFGAPMGQIRLVHKTDFTKYILFQLLGPIAGSGYRNLTVTVAASSGSTPFANGDRVLFMYTAAGAKGDQGDIGVTGSDGKTLLAPDIQVFQATGAGTWTKPTPPVGYSLGDVTRHLIAGGGGGGSGRRGAAGTIRGGGGGGGGGGYASDVNDASLFNATEDVFVGAGGAIGTGVTTNDTNGTAGGAGGDSYMEGSNGAGTLTATGGGGGGGGTTAAGAAGAAGTGNVQNGAAGGAGSILTGLAPDGGEVTTGVKNAGGGGGGGAGITAANTNTTTGGYGGASAGGRTSRTLGLIANAVANCLPHYVAQVGFYGPAFMANGRTPYAYGGGGGAGGANAITYATSFCGSAAGGAGGKYGGGGGGGAGYTNGAVTVSNDGFFGGDGIVIVVTEFV